MFEGIEEVEVEELVGMEGGDGAGGGRGEGVGEGSEGGGGGGRGRVEEVEGSEVDEVVGGETGGVDACCNEVEGAENVQHL